MNIKSLDTECTILNKGSPFDERNKLCVVSWSDGIDSKAIPIEYPIGRPYLDSITTVRDLVHTMDLIIGFNLKFDLHWLRRYGITLPLDIRIWDCQLAEFILSGQSKSYPSLDETGTARGLGGKHGGGLSSYWDLGIDTPDIDWEILEPYAKGDAELTYKIYLSQIEELKEKPRLKKLIELSNQDLRVLADMEWNGLKMDFELMKQREKETSEKLEKIIDKLNRIVNAPFVPNYNSPDFLSCLLYGGVFKIEKRIEIGQYQTGPKVGEPRYRLETENIPFKRLVEPLRRSELQKAGYYSTSVSTLPQLSAKGTAREIIKLLLAYSEYEKLQSTYYIGIQNLASKIGWSNGIIHGMYNQVVARTGRLSSSKPNLQNLSKEVDELVISRFRD